MSGEFETHHLPINAEKFRKANKWWNSKTPAAKRKLVKEHMLVSYGDLIKLWEGSGRP